MDIGNIVSKTKIEIENFKICDSLECVNEELPTLIIGRKLSKELLGENISILHKKISNNIYWTFDKTERKSEFESDLELLDILQSSYAAVATTLNKYDNNNYYNNYYYHCYYY
jgi:hypothetical protein